METKCTERDSVAYSASPACLGPEGLPTPRRSFVCFRLSARCETDSRGTGSGRAQAARKAEKRSQREKPSDPRNAAPATASERLADAGKRNDRTPAVSSTLPAYRCLERRLYPCKASTYCGWRSVQGGSYGTAPAGASDRDAEKRNEREKRPTGGPSRSPVRYWDPAGSGVRAAEGARLEIAWAGLTRLEGSNPSHSVRGAPAQPERSSRPLAFRGVSRAYSSAGERPLHTREVLGSIPSTPIVQRSRIHPALEQCRPHALSGIVGVRREPLGARRYKRCCPEVPAERPLAGPYAVRVGSPRMSSSSR